MRLLRWEVMLLLLLGLSLLVNSGSSSTCHGDDADDDGPSFTKAEALRKQSVAEGTDRDPAVQQQVFDVYRASLACDPQDGRSWMMLAFLSPFDSDRALLAAAPAGFVGAHFDVLHAAFINYFKMFAELILFAYFLESKPPAHCPRSLARAFANLRAVLGPTAFSSLRGHTRRPMC